MEASASRIWWSSHALSRARAAAQEVEAAAPQDATGVVFNSVDTRDIDEQAERLRGWSQEYIQVSPGHFAGSLREVWIGDVQVYRERTNCQLWERGAIWGDSLSLVMQLGADSAAVFNGDEVNKNSVIFCRGGDEWSVRSGKAWDVISLTVPISRLKPIVGDDLSAPPTALYANLPADARASLHRLVRASELTLDSGTGSSVAPLRFLGEYMVAEFAEVVVALLRSEQQPRDRNADPGLGQHLDLFFEACDRALSRTSELAFSIEGICKDLGVSRRSLQSCFQNFTGMPPHRFLRAVRLNHVRRSLVRAPTPEMSVLDVAADHGFWHGSRFARYYRDLFEELPSATQRR